MRRRRSRTNRRVKSWRNVRACGWPVLLLAALLAVVESVLGNDTYKQEQEQEA